MENAVKSRLQSPQPGELQLYKKIALIPLIAPANGQFQYRSLGEALATPDIASTEVSAPELPAKLPQNLRASPRRDW